MSQLSEYETFEPTTHPWGVTISLISFLAIVISFCSPYWLKNDGELSEGHFLNTGLWEACFSNYHDYTYRYDRIYDGCYWTLDEETHVIAEQLRRPFFVTVQVFYTFCFTLSLLGAGLTGVLILCPGEDFEKYVLKLAYIDLFISWFFGFIAVIVFGAMGDNRDWMPHWDHNHLSWSFGLAVVGVVAEFVAAVLFWVEYRIQKRKESYRQSHGVFTLEGGTKN
ncbi:uncharacterized protein [Penaeus vannamei]|uniref:Uncharacterized protein n=1 Tax=Penaeus vannamei TaxID=6689 RepID=A0A423SAG4_PENVA|nr:uncharacterized protein LOC113827154 isoform X2 [Penaeus vannamei]ROT61212.1 hypothetical protein C7M84_021045 [Penaeus vannamei]